MDKPSDAGKTQVWNLTSGQMRVIGEQVGPPERTLMSKIVPILARYSNIEAAYLVRVEYDQSGGEDIALCLVSGAPSDDSLVKELSRAFRETFSFEVHMDIVFLPPDQASRVLGSVVPFYRSK